LPLQQHGGNPISGDGTNNRAKETMNDGYQAKKIAVLATDGFEQVELTEPVNA
jgi:hypothetical protein